MKNLFSSLTTKSSDTNRVYEVDDLRKMVETTNYETISKAVSDTSPETQNPNEFEDTGFKIYSSTDYDKFIFRKDNRKVDFKMVYKLAQSISRYGNLVIAGTINGKNEIIDGQCRLMALKYIAETEGIFHPFYFNIQKNYGAKEMIAMNTTGSNWNKPDHLHHFTENDNENYIMFDKFLNDFPWLNLSTGYNLFTGKIDGKVELISKNKSNTQKRIRIRTTDFKEGLMVPDDIVLAYERAHQLQAVGEIYKNFKNTNFVKSFLQIKKVKGFSFDELIYQLQKVYNNKRNDNFKIKDDQAHTINNYRDCLNDIYNFKKHEDKCINLRSVKR